MSRSIYRYTTIGRSSALSTYVVIGRICSETERLLAEAVLDDYIAGVNPTDALEIQLEVERFIQDTKDNGPGKAVKLYLDGELIGFALPRRPSAYTRRFVKVGHNCFRLAVIWVTPKYRGYGLSKLIVHKCQSIYQELLWQCCITNKASAALAISCGYIPQDTPGSTLTYVWRRTSIPQGGTNT